MATTYPDIAEVEVEVPDLVDHIHPDLVEELAMGNLPLAVVCWEVGQGDSNAGSHTDYLQGIAPEILN